MGLQGDTQGGLLSPGTGARQPEPRLPTVGLGMQASGLPLGPLPGPLPALSRLPFKAFCFSAIYSEGSAASSYF